MTASERSTFAVSSIAAFLSYAAILAAPPEQAKLHLGEGLLGLPKTWADAGAEWFGLGDGLPDRIHQMARRIRLAQKGDTTCFLGLRARVFVIEGRYENHR